MKRFTCLVALTGASTLAFADLSYHSLAGGDFFQDWSNAGMITANDNWAGVPSITGYLGDDPSTTASGIDPQTILVDNLTVDVIANQNQPNTLTNGGVAEFDGIPNPVAALQPSGTADYPFLRILMDATGRSNVTISYNLRDIDGGGDNSIQPVALQYRLAGSGSWTNVAGGFVADASAGPNNTMTTPVTASLAVWTNASILEFRVITSNAPSNDEWIGVDDIRITSQAVPEPATMAALGLGFAALLRRRVRKP